MLRNDRPNKVISKNKIPLTFIFTVVFSFCVYRLTLSPTINSFDSAEFTTAAFTLGIIHSPGYPLYLLLAHSITLLPFGNATYNINLLNAFYGAIAIGVIFLCNWKLTQSWFSSLFCALLLGFTNLFWAVSVITEVYSFDALLISGVIYFLICFYQKPSKGNLSVMVFVYGINLSHHLNVILFAPGIALLILIKWKSRLITIKNIFVSGLVFLLPFLIYLYFPIRTIAHPPLDYVRDYFFVDLKTFSGVLWMLSGKMFGPEMFGRSLADGVNQFLILWKLVWLNLIGIGLLFSIYGLWVQTKENKPLAVFFGGSSFLVILFFAFYNVVDNSQMILPALILLTPTMALGLSQFFTKMYSYAANAQFAFNTFFLCILAVVLFANWPFVDRHQDWTAYYFSNTVMNQVDANAFIVTQWTAATPLEYVRLIEGIRPDVVIFDRGLYVLGLRDKLGNISTRDQIIFERLITKIQLQIQLRPVYITENDPLLNDYFCLVPDGIIYRLYNLNFGQVGCAQDDK